MGKKAGRLKPEATTAADSLVERLNAWVPARSRKMFGGYGIFSDDKMFALINSGGTIFLKVGDANRSDFEAVGSDQHGKMPYFELPEDVLKSDAKLREWSEAAIAVSRSPK